ncbi:uncharacterized protein [Typha latifolia]|uniref:uncharacterized protein n=1 Tax=Typha latifolia TaxID=4733 RepID=UPI003C2D3409
MELQDPSNGDAELRNPSNGKLAGNLEDFVSGGDEDYGDSTCSTPYVSAPSSPSRDPTPSGPGFFYSAPTSPVHSSSSFVLDSPSDSEFEFSARFPLSSASAAGSMSSADELFFNGQIRPMRLSSHLLQPQALPPLPDIDDNREDEARLEQRTAEISARGRDLKLRSRSIHRRARSHSPLRNAPLHWQIEGSGGGDRDDKASDLDPDPDPKQIDETTPPIPAAASRSSSSSSTSSSSSSRSSKRWIFLKDLLHRSKSEGRSTNAKERFWHSISFAPSSSKERSKPPPSPTPTRISESEKTKPRKPAANGSVGRRRRAPSAHERLYAANRAQAEEMRRRTFLPYRQGLLGCLGFSSRSYGAINGFARGLNAVSSR